MKNSLYRALLALPFLLLASGCNESTRESIPAQDALSYSPATEAPNEGFLVGTFAVTGPKADKRLVSLNRDDFLLYQTYSFMLRKIDEPERGLTADIAVKRQSLGYAYDYKRADGIGSAFAIPLPPGKYEFYQYIFDDGARKWKPRKDFSFVIEIKAGRALYIGETVAHKKTKINNVNESVADGGYFSSSDQLGRDQKIFERKFPFLSGMPLDNQIIAPALEKYYGGAEK